jgi:CyaY protein
MMEEAEFRKKVEDALSRIAQSLDEVDPDVAEYEKKAGQLTIQFTDRSKCILSTQPSVRQLWLAIAARGTAYHFNLDGDRWIDDKGKGIELFAFLGQFLREMIGGDFRLKSA